VFNKKFKNITNDLLFKHNFTKTVTQSSASFFFSFIFSMMTKGIALANVRNQVCKTQPNLDAPPKPNGATPLFSSWSIVQSLFLIMIHAKK
jgi:hypothetical protein